MLPKTFQLSGLHSGHPGPLIRSLRGRFDPQKMDVFIQLGELSCGCWVVLDGNNRIAMILKRNADATLEALPLERVSFLPHGEWDHDTFAWWNPNPQTFAFLQFYSTEYYQVRRNKRHFSSTKDYEFEIARLTGILAETPHRCSPRG